MLLQSIVTQHWSPLSCYTSTRHHPDICLHCPDVEHTAQARHLFTLSGCRPHGTGRKLIYTVRIWNTRHRPDTCLHCPDTWKHGTGRTLGYSVRIFEHRAHARNLTTLRRYLNTRNRPDTYWQGPDTWTRGSAGHLLTLSRTGICNILLSFREAEQSSPNNSFACSKY